jgi:hypothetical protein
VEQVLLALALQALIQYLVVLLLKVVAAAVQPEGIMPKVVALVEALVAVELHQDIVFQAKETMVVREQILGVILQAAVVVLLV